MPACASANNPAPNTIAHSVCFIVCPLSRKTFRTGRPLLAVIHRSGLAWLDSLHRVHGSEPRQDGFHVFIAQTCFWERTHLARPFADLLADARRRVWLRDQARPDVFTTVRMAVIAVAREDFLAVCRVR